MSSETKLARHVPARSVALCLSRTTADISPLPSVSERPVHAHALATSNRRTRIMHAHPQADLQEQW